VVGTHARPYDDGDSHGSGPWKSGSWRFSTKLLSTTDLRLRSGQETTKLVRFNNRFSLTTLKFPRIDTVCIDPLLPARHSRSSERQHRNRHNSFFRRIYITRLTCRIIIQKVSHSPRSRDRRRRNSSLRSVYRILGTTRLRCRWRR